MSRVVVGMSGGVDSSVAAYLLKEQGYDVIGVTMQIWQEEDACSVEENGGCSVEENGGCCGLSAVEDARRVAAALGIPYYVMNFREDFRKNVIDYFADEYLHGHTPNPCIACNRYVKWEALLDRSRAIGADYIATGHYARVEKLENGRYAIRRSASLIKDQTYALYNLTQEQLAHTLMPAGAYSKDEIRSMAEKIGLLVADKPDRWRTSRTARISASCRTGIMRPLSGTIRAGTSRKEISSRRTGRSLGNIKGSSIIRWDSAKASDWRSGIRLSCWRSGRRPMKWSSGLMKNP